MRDFERKPFFRISGCAMPASARPWRHLDNGSARRGTEPFEIRLGYGEIAQGIQAEQGADHCVVFRSYPLRPPCPKLAFR
jgi:hypothetical protein